MGGTGVRIALVLSYSVLSDYPRRAHFDFYRAHPAPFYSVTFELDATRLRQRLADERAPVYAGLCWHFHRALLTLPAFRVRLAGDDLVLHDCLRMGLTVPAPRRSRATTWPREALGLSRSAGVSPSMRRYSGASSTSP